MGTDLFKAHREGRRGATLFESSSVSAAPHAWRWAFTITIDINHAMRYHVMHDQIFQV
jgi:hypothetical protein